MIGRGDLGVEIPFEELPISKSCDECRLLGAASPRRMMLESMIYNPVHRAEISE